MLPAQANIVIVGGGVMGASCAYHLAKRGVKNVVLLERESFFGQGSTGHCAGGIRHQFSTDVNIELSKVSIQMLIDFEQTTGQVVDVKQYGYLFLLSTETEIAQFQRNVDKQHQHGVMSELWTTAQIAERVPLLNLDGIIGGTYYAKDGLADPSGVVNGYITAARNLGLQAFTDTIVTGLVIDDGQIQAVDTHAGTIATKLVINAAGAWAPLLGKMAGVTIPIRPERQQCLVTTPMPAIPADFPFVIDFHQRLYFHREGAGLLTGLSIIEQPPTYDLYVDPNWTLQHMDRAMERLPVMETAGKLTEWAGLYETTPDAHPIIGAVPGVQGLHLVAGFSGHGFMHGPVAGLLVAEQLLDGQAHTVDISELHFERFTSHLKLQEFNVV